MSLTCKGFDLIIVIGSLLSRSDTSAVTKMQACMKEGAKLIYLFTMEDPKFSAKSDFFSRYEVGSEEGVLALLAKALLENREGAQEFKAYFESLDEGYLSAESNLGEEEIEEIRALYAQSKGALLWLGDDVLLHPRADNCLLLAQAISSHSHAVVYGGDASIVEFHKPFEPVEALKSYDGTVVYTCLKHEGEDAVLIGSAQFKVAAKVQNGDTIAVTFKDEVYPCTFVCDDSLKGTIALMPVAQAPQKYPYGVAKIVKADVQ